MNELEQLAMVVVLIGAAALYFLPVRECPECPHCKAIEAREQEEQDRLQHDFDHIRPREDCDRCPK